MNELFTPVYALGCVLGLINLYISIIVIRCPFYSPTQKLAQCLIVWLIPIIGPVGIWSFMRAQYNWQKYDTRAYPEPSQKMVAVEINNAIHDSFPDAGGSDGGVGD